MQREAITRLAVVVVAVFGAGTAACAGAISVTAEPLATQVGRYEKIEFRIQLERSYDDPYDPAVVDVRLVVQTPGGGELAIPAFFAQEYEVRRSGGGRGGKVETSFYPIGMGVWKARFTPLEPGEHRATIEARDRQDKGQSQPMTFTCVESSRKGYVRAGKKDPRFFEFDNGEPFFVIGQNLAFVGEGQYVNLAKADEIFATMAANGANYARIWTCCKDWAMCLEGRKSAWSRSWSQDTPIVPVPGDATGRKCLRLGGGRRSIECSPSHAVALTPNTRYVVSGRFMADGGVALELNMAHGIGQARFEAEKAGQWTGFRREFTTGAGENRLGRISVAAVGDGNVYLDGLSLTEASGGAELLWEADVNRRERGTYNQIDCAMLDELVGSAEKHGIYLMLCAVNRDLYMDSLSKVGSEDYNRATADTKKFLRYCVARWGYSTAVAAWECFNEMDPGKPTDACYGELARYLEQIDIYRHPWTTSTWHPSARDIRLDCLDIGQLHHYMRPQVEGDYRDEVAVIVDLTKFLRDNGLAKPVLIGEFGLATPKWGLSDDMKTDAQGIHFRRSLWASAFAGSSGTAMFWWWDLLDRQNAYGHYKPLADFLKGVSFAGLKITDASVGEPVRVLGYQGDDRAYLWLSDSRTNWHTVIMEGKTPPAVASCRLTVPGLADGAYRVTWWDTQAGEVVETVQVESRGGSLGVTVPVFAADMACRIER